MAERGPKFIFEGNDVCLDFINTKGRSIDLLGNCGDLADWLAEAGCIDPGTAERILSVTDSEGVEMLEKVREFRSKLKDVVRVISEGKPLRRSLIEPVNEILKKDSAYSNLILIDGKPRLISHCSSAILDPRLPIAQAAAELLTNKDHSLIRKCSNPECVLYFYDESKNHARRWCSMQRCGNRMKAALHYRRNKSGGSAGPV